MKAITIFIILFSISSHAVSDCRFLFLARAYSKFRDYFAVSNSVEKMNAREKSQYFKKSLCIKNRTTLEPLFLKEVSDFKSCSMKKMKEGFDIEATAESFLSLRFKSYKKSICNKKKLLRRLQDDINTMNKSYDQVTPEYLKVCSIIVDNLHHFYSTLGTCSS